MGTRATPALAEAVGAVSALRGSPLGWRRAVLWTRNGLPFAIHVGAIVRAFCFRRFICALCLMFATQTSRNQVPELVFAVGVAVRTTETA